MHEPREDFRSPGRGRDSTRARGGARPSVGRPGIEFPRAETPHYFVARLTTRQGRQLQRLQSAFSGVLRSGLSKATIQAWRAALAECADAEVRRVLQHFEPWASARQGDAIELLSDLRLRLRAAEARGGDADPLRLTRARRGVVGFEATLAAVADMLTTMRAFLSET